MSVLQRLTEGVIQRNVQKEGEALLNKWEATGLLQGLREGQQKQGMAVLLENQAKELLREASSMSAGDVEGFAAVAFPIVRRVFGGLIANDLISVQPMSLPSGLIFFMDFTHTDARSGFAAETSLYGGGVVGKGITDGVTDITETGFYGLRSGYSSASGSFVAVNPSACSGVADGAASSAFDYDPDLRGKVCLSVASVAADSHTVAQADPGAARAMELSAIALGAAGAGTANSNAHTGFPDPVTGDLYFSAKAAAEAALLGENVVINARVTVKLSPIRRLASFGTATDAVTGLKSVTHLSRVAYEVVTVAATDVDTDAAADLAAAKTAIAVAADQKTITAAHATAIALALESVTLTWTVPQRDEIGAGAALGALQAGAMPLEEPIRAGGGGGDAKASGAAGGTQGIPEIDIKVDSVAVTAQTKKLKAKWTPELGQDLNAYHNLDAEVELTGILSEQIALEIDRELLGELVDGAKAGTRFWSRAPGLFVNSSGTEMGATSAAPDFTGTVSEWYETLIETINDVSAQIHRKTLRGGANFVVCSPEVANILEFTSGFRASVTADTDRGTIGAVKSGSLSKKFDVYVDPYFLRNVLLVGRKGSSFLESGYVYAPYVPLQVTPTIFGTEDFVPRKGVMTRYAKKMVRPDMYGLVIVRGLLGESGA
jgi:hypothetical protein